MSQSERFISIRMRFGAALRAILCSWVVALSVGFVLFFFSETMFWARPNRAPISELLVTWFAYSVLASATLYAFTTFRVHRLPALFLCSALYGWLVEGVLAGTMYDAFPVQLSWTGLAWHALLSVCAGWYGITRALQRSMWYTMLVAAGLGVFWGTWAVMWWQPVEGGVVTSLADFALHAFAQGALLIVAFAVFPRLLSSVSFTSRWGRGIITFVVMAWFAIVIVPQQQIALLIAPTVFGLTLFTLSHSQRTTAYYSCSSLFRGCAIPRCLCCRDALCLPIRCSYKLATLFQPTR